VIELQLTPLPEAEREEAARIRALQSGSEEAFSWLISQYAQPVFRLASRILTDASDASDVVQEVFLKVFRNIGKFESGCSLKTWIYRITVHTASNQNRWWRRHRERELPLDGSPAEDARGSILAVSDTAGPLELLLSRETQQMVRQALSRLSESSRTVLVLREIEGLSYEEVSEVLHVNLGTVKSRLARARQTLRSELEPVMEPELAQWPALRTAE